MSHVSGDLGPDRAPTRTPSLLTCYPRFRRGPGTFPRWDPSSPQIHTAHGPLPSWNWGTVHAPRLLPRQPPQPLSWSCCQGQWSCHALLPPSPQLRAGAVLGPARGQLRGQTCSLPEAPSSPRLRPSKGPSSLLCVDSPHPAATPPTQAPGAGGGHRQVGVCLPAAPSSPLPPPQEGSGPL